LPVTKIHAIGVDVLAEQSYFNDALINQRPNFPQDLFFCPIFFNATKGWNNAESAGVVASDRD
jgi:hypothetical protein